MDQYFPELIFTCCCTRPNNAFKMGKHATPPSRATSDRGSGSLPQAGRARALLARPLPAATSLSARDRREETRATTPPPQPGPAAPRGTGAGGKEGPGRGKRLPRTPTGPGDPYHPGAAHRPERARPPQQPGAREAPPLRPPRAPRGPGLTFPFRSST